MVLFLIIFNNNLKSFEYKAKLLGNAVADGENEILRNTTITVPFKYFSNFWGSLKMSLINSEIEMKLKWTKYYVLSAAGADNVNVDSNNIILL